VLLARRYGRNRTAWSRLNRLQIFYQRGVGRAEDRFAGTGFSGEEFEYPGHPFAADLSLFGTGSLFELLCTTRTQIGRQRLADYLLETPDLAEVKARQEAVRELSGQTKLREDIALLGKVDFRESSGKTFSNWLSATEVSSLTPLPIVILAVTTSVLLVSLMAWTYFAMPLTLASLLTTGPWIAALLVINAIIGVTFRRRAKVPRNATKQMGIEVGVLREGIALVQRQSFESIKLRAIQEELAAAGYLRQLERITKALDTCDNPFLQLLATLLIAQTQLWFAIERWRFHHGESLTRWMHAWAEFEALAAVSGYAYENPANQFPEFIEGERTLEARALGHPMLPEPACVKNDISLGKTHPFYVISGSNMAGKSTLLRAIGLNLALAGAGAPVRAHSLKLSRFAVCASIGVMDSLREGKSKFLAEIAKLRQTIEIAREKSALFLIDEILAGTNSQDRRLAAESVVRTLVSEGAVGLLSTHDLALTEIADIPELNGSNVHMGSSDPMNFDYLLKPGIIRESNAIAIAEMAGVLPTDRMGTDL
jgi:hypothetical protein